MRYQVFDDKRPLIAGNDFPYDGDSEEEVAIEWASNLEPDEDSEGIEIWVLAEGADVDDALAFQFNVEEVEGGILGYVLEGFDEYDSDGVVDFDEE